MGETSDWIKFRNVIRQDLSIGSDNVVQNVPNEIIAADFLYFFLFRDLFWKDVVQENRPMIAAALTEMYLSTLIHSAFETFSTRDGHEMERAVLYGDLLSGTAAELLLNNGKEDLLYNWLLLFENIHGNLIKGSLDQVEDIQAYRKKILGVIIDYICRDLSEEARNKAKNGMILFDSSHFHEVDFPDVPAEVAKLFQKNQLEAADFAVMAGEID